MSRESAVDFPVAAYGIGEDRGLDANHFAQDRLERAMRDVGPGLDVRDLVPVLVHFEYGLLELVSAPSPIDCPDRAKCPSGSPATGVVFGRVEEPYSW